MFYFWWFHTPNWRRQWGPTPVLFPGKSHGRGGGEGLVGCSPWGREESDTAKRLHFHFSFSWIGEGKGNSLQCSCLENPRDGGAWWVTVYGVTQSQTWLKQLSSSSSSSILQTVPWSDVVVICGKESHIWHAAKSPGGLVKTVCWAPCSQSIWLGDIDGVWEFLFLTSSQMLLMLPFWEPYFENHYLMVLLKYCLAPLQEL